MLANSIGSAQPARPSAAQQAHRLAIVVQARTRGPMPRATLSFALRRALGEQAEAAVAALRDAGLLVYNDLHARVFEDYGTPDAGVFADGVERGAALRLALEPAPTALLPMALADLDVLIDLAAQHLATVPQ